MALTSNGAVGGGDPRFRQQSNDPRYGPQGDGGGGGGFGDDNGGSSIKELLQQLLEGAIGGVDLSGFQNKMDKFNPRFFNVANQLRDISRGEDPRFAAYQQGQFNVLGANEQSQLGQTSSFFERRGGGGGTAELNALNRTSGGFDLQRQALSGQLGMQQLQRQDPARTGQLDAISGGLQNMLAGPTMNMSLLAALLGGKGGDGGGNGLLSKLLE